MGGARGRRLLDSIMIFGSLLSKLLLLLHSQGRPIHDQTFHQTFQTFGLFLSQATKKSEKSEKSASQKSGKKEQKGGSLSLDSFRLFRLFVWPVTK